MMRWRHAIDALLGVWLMAAPALFEHELGAATVGRIVGLLLVVFSLSAMWEALRPLRWANAALALALAIAPLPFGYGGLAAANQLAVAVLVVLLMPPARRDRTRFGGGWAPLRRR